MHPFINPEFDRFASKSPYLKNPLNEELVEAEKKSTSVFINPEFDGQESESQELHALPAEEVRPGRRRSSCFSGSTG